MMKRFLMIAALVCLTMRARAAWNVELPKQGLGVQIGWAQPILRVNDATHKDTLNNYTRLKGFKVGVVYDASFVKGFGCSMGINYTFAATSTPWVRKVATQPTLYPQVHDKIRYHEVEIFVDWQYKFELAKETYLMLYTGPTIQCGIAFNAQRDERSIGGVITPGIDGIKRYTTDDPDKILKRMNVTWGLGAGFQYKRYFLRGGYDFGLIVPYKNQDFTTGVHARGRLDQWQIKIGMYLWYED